MNERIKSTWVKEQNVKLIQDKLQKEQFNKNSTLMEEKN
jgi:hypothetical protein